MSFFDALNTSASGLTAQRLRLDIISENIANADTTKTASGGPYKRKITVFEEKRDSGGFADYFNEALGTSYRGRGIRATGIKNDQREGTKVYEPSHPDSDADGYLTKPNVNIVEEMVDMIAASRSYEANATAISVTKTMIAKTLEISSR